MERIQTSHPEWYRVGYLYTSQNEPDKKYIIESIEAHHTGLSFPIYYLNCKLIKKTNLIFTESFWN